VTGFNYVGGTLANHRRDLVDDLVGDRYVGAGAHLDVQIDPGSQPGDMCGGAAPGAVARRAGELC
jgi:hypothetical protein